MLYFFMLTTYLVRMEDRFCATSDLEPREAQNDHVRCYRKQSRVNIVCDNYAVDQPAYILDTVHNEKFLKCQSEQTFEVFHADAAQYFTIFRLIINLSTILPAIAAPVLVSLPRLTAFITE